MTHQDLNSYALLSLLRKASPEALCTLFSPFSEFFTQHAMAVPGLGGQPVDGHVLMRFFTSEATKTPAELEEAMVLLSEVIRAANYNDLCECCDRYNLEINGEMTLEDMAVMAFVANPDILHHLRNERQLNYPRTCHEYVGQDPEAAHYEINADWVGEAEEELAGWFHEHQHGNVAKIFEYEKDGYCWFLIYHGKPMKRVTCIQDDQPASIKIRPDEVDKVLFDYENNRLLVNARDEKHAQKYLSLFGEFLFEDKDFFSQKQVYSLDGLLHDRKMLLRCDDVMGVDRVELESLEITPISDDKSAVLLHGKSIDTFLSLLPDLSLYKITMAKFVVYFSGYRYPRVVKVTPPNRIKQTRDYLGGLVQQWITKRKLAMCVLNDQQTTISA